MLERAKSSFVAFRFITLVHHLFLLSPLLTQGHLIPNNATDLPPPPMELEETWEWIPITEQEIKLFHIDSDNNDTTPAPPTLKATTEKSTLNSWSKWDFPERPFPLNYLHLNLTIKNQKSSSSCLSQAFTTALEAYFKLRQTAFNEWSGFDLYYCVFPILKFWFNFAKNAIINKPIASSACRSSKTLATFSQKKFCPERVRCLENSAVIKNIKVFEEPRTSFIVTALLKQWGPIIAGIQWDEGLYKYLRMASQGEISNDNKVFFRQDWPSSKMDRIKNFLNGHSVVILGFDYDDKGRLYWILQNSHGKRIGFNGLFYLGENELNILNLPMAYIAEASLETTISDTKTS